MRPVGRSGRAEPGSAPDQRRGRGPGQLSRDAGDERRPPGTKPGRAVKVRPGSATDLLFNPAAEDYDQPLYAPPGDDGQPLYAPPGNYGQARSGRQPDDRFTSPQRRLDTAEYAAPLYPSLDAGPATDARQRRARPTDDPLADTDARGRSAGLPPRSRRDDRTGPQRRIADSGDVGALTGPERVDTYRAAAQSRRAEPP